ncbi:MAG: hypothetical protein R3321_14435 [Nitrososphaeraceae archaeon]|nr:hypothetical protein [Nitrososphaeraceae archaeon]
MINSNLTFSDICFASKMWSQQENIKYDVYQCKFSDEYLSGAWKELLIFINNVRDEYKASHKGRYQYYIMDGWLFKCAKYHYYFFKPWSAMWILNCNSNNAIEKIKSKGRLINSSNELNGWLDRLISDASSGYRRYMENEKILSFFNIKNAWWKFKRHLNQEFRRVF